MKNIFLSLMILCTSAMNLQAENLLSPETSLMNYTSQEVIKSQISQRAGMAVGCIEDHDVNRTSVAISGCFQPWQMVATNEFTSMCTSSGGTNCVLGWTSPLYPGGVVFSSACSTGEWVANFYYKAGTWHVTVCYVGP